MAIAITHSTVSSWHFQLTPDCVPALPLQTVRGVCQQGLQLRGGKKVYNTISSLQPAQAPTQDHRQANTSRAKHKDPGRLDPTCRALHQLKHRHVDA